MGLLEYLTAHAVDEDYAFVSARKAPGADDAGQGEPDAPRIGLLGALVLALFAVLVVTAAVQTSRNAGQRRARAPRPGRAGARRPQPARPRPSAGWRSLRRETARLQAQQLSSDRTAQGLLDQLQPLGALTGAERRPRPGRAGRGRRRARAPAPRATRCSTPTCRSWSTGSGRPAPRRSRSTASGSPTSARSARPAEPSPSTTARCAGRTSSR